MKDHMENVPLPKMTLIPHSLSFMGFLSQVTFVPHVGVAVHALLPPASLTSSPYRSVTRTFTPRHRHNGAFQFSLTNWALWGETDSTQNGAVVNNDDEGNVPGRIRIGIIGGGIAGVSASHALAKKLLDRPDARKRYQIVLLEGDPHSAAAIACTSSRCTDKQDHDRSISPHWHAATAKNANSIVPGAAMHIFSRKSVMWQVVKDTVAEWYYLKKEALRDSFSFGKPKPDKVLATTLSTSRRDDFAFSPPYFALHLWECLGTSATSEERASFLRYLKNYLYATILLGDQAADLRGKLFCDLAKANRSIFLEEAENLNKKGYGVEFTNGFLALYRSLSSAQKSVKESLHHGEEARLMEWEEAVELEPRLKYLPVAPLYVVHRPNDLISGCESFIQALSRETMSLGVRICGPVLVEKVEVLTPRKDNSGPSDEPRFRAICMDGSSYDFDIVVLAAGIYTPILASKMGVGDRVPIYPLRGFSLTMNAWQQEKPEGNLLKQPFSVDSMYCSSVSPWMARWAGFGEFAGYPHASENVPSLGPGVLSRYAMNVFPDAVNANASATLTCSRPVSPDDLPIVGAIPTLPGLFVHSGHGTLGWTTGLATGRCVAETIIESLDEDTRPEEKFRLPGGLEIDRKALSPSRFL